jgi:hypothetical protein
MHRRPENSDDSKLSGFFPISESAEKKWRKNETTIPVLLL